MPDHELLTVAAAYDNGQTGGKLFFLILVAAIGYSLLRRWLTGTFTPRFRAGIAVMSVVCVGLLAAIGYSARGDGTGTGREMDPDRARAEMLAGCVNTGGEEQRSYCVCVVDEVMKRNGTSDADLKRLSAEMREFEEKGTQAPAVLTQSVDVCVRRTG